MKYYRIYLVIKIFFIHKLKQKWSFKLFWSSLTRGRYVPPCPLLDPQLVVRLWHTDQIYFIPTAPSKYSRQLGTSTVAFISAICYWNSFRLLAKTEKAKRMLNAIKCEHSKNYTEYTINRVTTLFITFYIRPGKC